jgi:hypothetical protein
VPSSVASVHPAKSSSTQTGDAHRRSAFTPASVRGSAGFEVGDVARMRGTNIGVLRRYSA